MKQNRVKLQTNEVKCKGNFFFLFSLFIFLFSLLTSLFSPALFAKGNREIITETADGIDIWQHEFDVTGKKKGTYNIIINAKDAAGNVGTSGPFNIRIDPMAGLPEARVVYPEHKQVVREDVSIVGVASARYGVKQILVKIDDGEYQELEGGAYWSLFIPATDLAEGSHTIYVKAIDNHDLTGPEAKINFILDITPPDVELIGLQIGDFISGSVKIQGRVDDPNGIQGMALSYDGENFTGLKTSKKRGETARTFNFPINTKNYEDGPLVCYLRATNATGSSITRPYLFFVNNFPPQIEIISPKVNDDLFGNTQVTGRVITGVGLSEFYYEWAGERKEIPLRPGDPFWSVTFPISMANNRAIPFRVTAVDKSGNVTAVSQNFQDTRANRTPVLTVDNPPLPGGLGRMNLEWDQPIYGHILPGFFAASIIIEGEIEQVAASPCFRIDPALIPEGRSTMRLWAMDEEDVIGERFTLRINKAAAPPGAEMMQSQLTINSPEEYAWFGDSVTVQGYVDYYAAGQALEYRLSFDDNWKQAGVDPSGAFSVTIDISGFPEGAVPLEFRTIRNGRADYPLYLPVNKYLTLPVVSFFVPSEEYGSIHGEVTTAGTVDYFVPLSDISYSLDGGATFESTEFIARYGKAWFRNYFDYSAIRLQNQQLIIRALDRAGNTAEASPSILFDDSNDFPTLILNSPLEGAIMSGDFEISGIAFDDDALALVYWRILSPDNPWDPVDETINKQDKNVEFSQYEIEQNFSFPVGLFELRDGENILEIYVEDIYGTVSETIRRVFKVSTAVPFTVVETPVMDFWNRRNIEVSGTAFDLNGIYSIMVSMDNGVSYQRAKFASSQTDPSPWSITLNTEVYADGIYSMLIRTVDHYGISSFASGIINIDNTPPAIDLGSPANGEKMGVDLAITGQIVDNIELTRISIFMVSVENPQIQMFYELPPQSVLMEKREIFNFPDGEYTLTVSAFDQSGNETSLVRNFNILKAAAGSEVALTNPMDGIAHNGPLAVSGRISGAVIPETVTLVLNGSDYAEIEVNRYGIFRYEMTEEAVTEYVANAVPEEPAVFSTYFLTPGKERIDSLENVVEIGSYGPMLVVDSHQDGDVITRRPFFSGRPIISGRAFYLLPPDELSVNEGIPLDDDEYDWEEEAIVADADDELAVTDEETEIEEEAVEEPAVKRNYGPAVKKIEYSIDNGRGFKTARGREKWKFSVEPVELDRGTLPVIIKATFADDSVAIRRIILVVDTRPPVVKTIGPTENSAHRTEVAVYGSAGDDYDMDSVEVSLRPGNKNLYAVPGFVQGLYLDFSGLGGLNYSMGLGLTFFDDNVKVQFNVSQAGSGSRYSGWAFGGKVLANVWTKNLGEWLGPDWIFLSTSFTVGAHFSYFLMEEQWRETPVVMGQLISQWEIFKADLQYFVPKWKYFKTISLYTEPGLWFAPSDIDGQDVAWRVRFTIGFGGRISLF